jgi:hypothetical protein
MATKTVRFMVPLIVPMSILISLLLSKIKSHFVMISSFLIAIFYIIGFYSSFPVVINETSQLKQFDLNESIYILGDEVSSKIKFDLLNDKYLMKNNLKEILCSSTYDYYKGGYILFSPWSINLSKKIVPGYLVDKKKIYDDEIGILNHSLKVKEFKMYNHTFSLFKVLEK